MLNEYFLNSSGGIGDPVKGFIGGSQLASSPWVVFGGFTYGRQRYVKPV